MRLIRLTTVSDLRGNLVAGQWPDELPFEPRRFFTVFGVPSVDVRGEHAHRECEQFLVAVAGSLAVVVDDGHRRQEYALDSPGVGLHLPAMTWAVQYKYSRDAVLLALASHPYSAADYIRDYDEFLELVRNRERFNW